MKVLNLSLLIILLMADTCWSYNVCRMANWWFTFDSQGWSKCRSDEYVTGFFRNHRSRSDPIYKLEEARCCTATYPYLSSSTCEYTDWWAALDSNDRWATCRTGYFVRELYRSHGHDVSNIEAARCCKPNTHPDDHYGHCYHEDVRWSFDKKGLSKCADGYYLAGIYRGSCNDLHCIDRFKCCQMA